jgi:RNA polymerase sigma factor (sigma-70 family)
MCGDIEGEMSDRDLLEQFAEDGSEAALEELMRRYIPLVYSLALRQTRNDTLLAGEIAQETFCVLARKARTLRSNVLLSGWLCRTALNLAQVAVRGEQRRRRREEEASFMQRSGTPEEVPWEEVSPHVDAALDLLAEPDREALVLRFFERKRACDLAERYGISEEAARMRVSRALGRLRVLLARRGLPVSTAALGVWLAENTIAEIAPGIADSIGKGVRASLDEVQGTAPARFSPRPGRHWVVATSVTLFVIVSPFLYRAIKMSRESSSAGKTENAAAAAKQQSGLEARSEFAVDLEAAAAALRKALRDPWPSRIPPVGRIDEALKNYGRQRRAAVPVLMEMLLGERKNHTYESQVLAAHGLMVLGPESSDSLDDLLILHDSGDLHFLDEREADLFAAIDPAGATIGHFLEEIAKGPRMPVTTMILAGLLRNNPGVAPLHRESLFDLLHSPATAPMAALVLARVPSLYEPEVLTALSRLIDEAQMQGWRDDAYSDNYSLKFLLLPAIDGVRELRAKESIPQLLEVAERDDLPERIRNAAFSAISEIDPASRIELAPVAEWYTRHEKGTKLAEKIGEKKASFDEVVAGLQHRESVKVAAQEISQEKDLVSRALPSILHSVELFADPDAIACLKLVPVSELVEQVRLGNTDGVQYVAQLLTFAKPAPKEAAPILEEILDRLDQRKPTIASIVTALDIAVRQIDGTMGMAYLDDWIVQELRKLLFEVGASDPEIRERTSALLGYLDGKVYARRSVVLRHLEGLLRDKEFREAFVRNRRIATLSSFLPLAWLDLESYGTR